MEPAANDVKDIGPYRVVGVLGEGGMGIVYAAEQRHPISRRVALKVIKVGMDTKEVLARFEAERQALALLDHPNIARVLDAGSTAAGRPFFAMELVRGLPITRYCDEARLSVSKRIDVLLQACAAIQHAHVRGILHRDVKPSNLLVTEVDGAPVVKVIDFGLAKAMNQRLTERTLFTEEGRIIGTPEYMSPEQAETSAQDVDARSDVFSLGVVLYELIAGALPFDFQAARAKGYFEVQRCIREDEPPTPRQRLSGMRATLDQVLALRRCRMQELAASLKHGLDAVTMKAIAKARGDRYSSCEDFSADLRRFLAGEPVSARTPGFVAATTHRLRRLRRRHPTTVPAVLLATLVGLATWWSTRPGGSGSGVSEGSPAAAGDGVVSKQGNLEDGRQTGEWQFYYESGQPRARGRFDADRQAGIWTSYFESGRVEWNGAFDTDGKRTGEWIFFHPDGAMRARGRYVADAEDGPWTFFRASGDVERSGQYDNGVMSGPWLYYHDGEYSRQPKARGFCYQGARVGVWTLWNEAGSEAVQDFGTGKGLNLVTEQWPSGARRRGGLVRDGRPIGRWTTWHENGGLRFCCGVRDGKVWGVFDARLPDGTPLAQGVVDEGEFSESTLGFENGKSRRIEPGPMPRETRTWVSTSELKNASPEAGVAILAAEILSPLSFRGRDPASPVAVAEPAPTPEQPRLQVMNRDEIAEYVRAYAEDADAVARLEMQERLPSLKSIRTAAGRELNLVEFVGKRKVLIVFMRGFFGEVCVYCLAQTKALSEARERLAALNVETIVVYPGPRETAAAFLQTYRTTFADGGPFYHVAYDVDLELARALAIDGDGDAKPTSILIDEHGQVRHLHIGANRADRPAAKALVRIIESIDR